jgi:hypothetical protein
MSTDATLRRYRKVVKAWSNCDPGLVKKPSDEGADLGGNDLSWKSFGILSGRFKPLKEASKRLRQTQSLSARE